MSNADVAIGPSAYFKVVLVTACIWWLRSGVMFPTVYCGQRIIVSISFMVSTRRGNVWFTCDSSGVYPIFLVNVFAYIKMFSFQLILIIRTEGTISAGCMHALSMRMTKWNLMTTL